MKFIGFSLTIAVVVAAIGILNVGTAVTAAAECPTGGGGGGGGSSSPSPSGSASGSASPSGSAGDNLLDQAPLPVQTSGSPSPSGSSSSSGGPLPNLSTILPGGSSSPSPSGSASPSPTSGGEQAKCSTKVTIKYVRVSQRTSDPRDHFKGNVKSPNSDCQKGRDVLLKKVKAGKAKTVGRTVSAKSGQWKIRGVKPKGKFYALAKARPVGDVICKKGKSKTISP